MPYYLVKATVSPESWAALIGKPEDRRPAARQTIRAVGGELHGLWYAFGETDAYLLVEFPDNVAAATVSLAISASGHYRSLTTTPLITVEEMLRALDGVQRLPYRPPGS